MDSRTGLFGLLPEQMLAARPTGAPRLRKAERRQVSLRPLSLEDLLPPDHRARFVWAFAERLDLSALYGAIKAVEGHPGHPPADPRILLALWLYATVEGVGSARELDRLCREHIGFEWLCGGVGMNHTTLAEFRVAHGAVLERLQAPARLLLGPWSHMATDSSLPGPRVDLVPEMVRWWDRWLRGRRNGVDEQAPVVPAARVERAAHGQLGA